MNTWNYRLVRKRHNMPNGKILYTYAIHEVYYDKKQKPILMAEKPETVTGSSKKEVLAILKMMHDDIMKYPVFEFPKSWKGKTIAPAFDKEIKKNIKGIQSNSFHLHKTKV